MRLRQAYGREIDLPVFESIKHRMRELQRHAITLNACDYCFSHRCRSSRRSDKRRSWKNRRRQQHQDQ